MKAVVAMIINGGNCSLNGTLWSYFDPFLHSVVPAEISIAVNICENIGMNYVEYIAHLVYTLCAACFYMYIVILSLLCSLCFHTSYCKCRLLLALQII